MAASEDDGEQGPREVVTTGPFTLVAPDARWAMDEVVRLVGEVGGRVEERTEHGTGEDADVQVAMSTLRISVSAEQTVHLEAGSFTGGLQSGWGALVTFAGGLLVVLGTVLPWLLVVGVPLAVVVVLVRRRRRRETAPPAAPAPAA